MSGVVACAVTEGDRVRLVFDDARASSKSYPQEWRAMSFFTETSFPADAFDEAELTDDDFAKIGFALVARLGALRATTSRKR